MVIAFVGWLMTVRKISSNSVSQYLSGLRIVHLKNGVLPGNLRPDLINAILKGHSRIETVQKSPRLAMTIPVMKLLKKLLTISSMSLEKKRLLWTKCCMAFHGSFRIHELLSKEELTFDHTTTLLGADVRKISTCIESQAENLLIVHLKNPKEDKLRLGVNVELFSTGTFSCPVSAWTKWRNAATCKITATKPVFRHGDGKCMTGYTFNKEIKCLLGKFIDYDKGKFLSHSFRAGFASMMASAGYSDPEIMRQGRWHSQAFATYCKTGRGSRLKEQREIARNLTKLYDK